jgi:hypothetical protein
MNQDANEVAKADRLRFGGPREPTGKTAFVITFVNESASRETVFCLTFDKPIPTFNP